MKYTKLEIAYDFLIVAVQAIVLVYAVHVVSTQASYWNVLWGGCIVLNAVGIYLMISTINYSLMSKEDSGDSK